MTVALAKETGVHPIKLLPFATLGAFAGGLSSITPSGIVAVTKAAENGIMGLDWPLLWKMALTTALYGVILYFFVFKWHKFTPAPAAEGEENEKVPPFTGKQWATLIGIVVVAAMAFLGINVGLAAVCVAVLLTVFRCADEGAALKKISWGTLLMITGVGILISLVTELGGITLLRKGLETIIGEKTAASIMCLLAGVMSWFSSASGVVMPTLIPTVPGMVPGSELVITVGLCIGAHLAALSPLSSCGGLMLAAYSSDPEVTPQDRNRTFGQLFAMSACGVLFGGILALLGLYG
jgi:di/tricarboxylate transporter